MPWNVCADPSRDGGRSENLEGGGALCVEMGFYADISKESRCNFEINVWTHFYKILLVFEVPQRPRVKGMPLNKHNYQNLVKDASNLASFYGSHINGIVCEEQIGI